MKYNLIICGGTFDRLHEGHKAFLRFAFLQARDVVIGLTADTYVREQKKDPTILSFSQRKKTLEQFLENENFLSRAKIIAIESKFDQTQIAYDNKTALLLTEETKKAGEEINAEREKNNLPLLPLLIFPLVTNTSGKKISSSTLRTLLLPKAMREMLSKPFGPVVRDIPLKIDAQKLITVGDETTKRFLHQGISPKLAVVDFVIERKKQFASFQELGFLGNEKVYRIVNAAGTIDVSSWQILSEIVEHFPINKQTILFVAGEEDLLVIPLILLLPIGFTLFYGQPKMGMVQLDITQDLKHQMQKILAYFTSSTTPGY